MNIVLDIDTSLVKLDKKKILEMQISNTFDRTDLIYDVEVRSSTVWPFFIKNNYQLPANGD